MLSRAEAIGESDTEDLDDCFASDTFRRWGRFLDSTPLAAWLSEDDTDGLKRRLFISAQFATYCSSVLRE